MNTGTQGLSVKTLTLTRAPSAPIVGMPSACVASSCNDRALVPWRNAKAIHCGSAKNIRLYR